MTTCKLILLMFYFSRSENIHERSARFTSGLPKQRQVTFILNTFKNSIKKCFSITAFNQLKIKAKSSCESINVKYHCHIFIYIWSYTQIIQMGLCPCDGRDHIVWQLDLQLPVQSVPITTKIVNSNPTRGEVYSIHQYVIRFIYDLRQVVGFLQVLWFPPIKPTDHDIIGILLKVALNTITPQSYTQNIEYSCDHVVD